LIHNERIKLLATTINTVGMGVLIGGFVGPLVNGVFFNNSTVFVWFGIGVALPWSA